MFRDNLEKIAGISVYPMFSLIVFFVFFTLLLVYLVKADKQQFDEASHLPLNESDETND